eukprot:12029618-Heterocapsa_arctica.AAC.1
MVQRFKALEASKGVGGWSISQQYELIPPDSVGLSSEAERAMASRRELDRLRLLEAAAKASQARRVP